MLLRRFLALAAVFVLAFSIFTVSSFSKSATNSDKKGDVSWSWTDEQGPAKVGSPVQWARTVSISNSDDKEKRITIKNFPKKKTEKNLLLLLEQEKLELLRSRARLQIF